MSDLIAEQLAKATFVPHPTLEDLEATDAETRRSALNWKPATSKWTS